MVLTWSAMKVVVYIILMRTLVWNLIFIAKAQYSSVDQLSPVCCGADIATDSNEAFELFRRQRASSMPVQPMRTLKSITQPSATRNGHVLHPRNGHKNWSRTVFNLIPTKR